MVQRAKANIYSDVRAQKARALLLEVPEAAQPRVQQADASIHSERCSSTESEGFAIRITRG